MAEQRLTFNFLKCLGKGGFGEVYLATLARPGGLEKRVAVKVLKEDLRNAPEAVKRLRDEGRMLAILDHPCIVRVIEMTLIRGRVALVTEYLDGVDLARCCRPPRLLPPKVIVGALGEVASALHCAWTTISPETGKPLELIHRDVKPENIRIGRHGEVKLLDFGIARTTEMFRHAKTAVGDLPFTPGYAPPEAFTKGFQGPASDVYALGVTLYRLLAGERLYEDMELADQVTICCLPERYGPFVRQRLGKIDAPEPVLVLLRDMLAYHPLDRPTAQEVEASAVSLGDQLDGPTHVRWARATEFPEPIGLPDGTLTGETITEDRMVDAPRPARPRGVRLTPKEQGSDRFLLATPDDGPPRPLPVAHAVHPGAVADLTPPSHEPPRAPPPPTPVPGASRSHTPERVPGVVSRAGSLPPDAPVPVNRLGDAPVPVNRLAFAPPAPPPDLIGVRPVTGPVRAANPPPEPPAPEPEQGPPDPARPFARSPAATLDAFVDGSDEPAVEVLSPVEPPNELPDSPPVDALVPDAVAAPPPEPAPPVSASEAPDATPERSAGGLLSVLLVLAGLALALGLAFAASLVVVSALVWLVL